MQTVSTRTVIMVALALSLLITIGLWVSEDTERQQHPAAANVATTANTGPTSSSALPLSKPGNAPKAPVHRAHDNGRRAELSEVLTRAREAREAHLKSQHGAASRVSPIASDVPSSKLQIANKTGSTDAWELRQLDTLSGLLGECYDLASEEDPQLSGTIGIRFRVSAEPDIGGLVDGVEFMAEHSSIEDANMRECMRESMYALELDPPPAGLMVEREITLRLEP